MFQTLFTFGLMTHATLVKMRKKNKNKFTINDNAPPFFLLGLNVQLIKLPFFDTWIALLSQSKDQSNFHI